MTELHEKDGELLVPKDSIRAWAAKNAFLLIYLAVLAVITWIFQVTTAAISG